MDSVTQIVLGAAVGEAVLGKKIGNKAMLWGAIAGTIPDLDVIAKFFYDPITANELHRGFSHSFLFSFFAAPILGFLLFKVSSRGVGSATFKEWTVLFFLGLVTHPLLDAFTTWGTQLFWPLDYKVSFKNIFVVDPLYTLPFLIFLLLAMFQNRASPKRRWFNKMGLLVSSCYMIATLFLKWFTFHKFKDSLNYHGLIYEEMQTKPTPLNSVLWSATVQSASHFRVGYYSIFDDDKPIKFQKFAKNHHLLGSMKNDPLVHRLIKLSEGWYTIEKIGKKIFFNDLRFGQMGVREDSSNFVFSYALYYNKRNKLQAIERKRKPEEILPLLRGLYKRALGEKK